MANLLFLDSFDHYNATNNATKYPDTGGYNVNLGEYDSYKINSTFGRNGQGLRILTSGFNADQQTTLTRITGMGGPRSTWGFGFAFKLLGMVPDTVVPIFGLIDTGTIYTYIGPFFATQVAFYLTKAQTIRLASGEPEGTTLISSSQSIRRNIWNYVEVNVTIGAVGAASLILNGELIGTFSGDTRGTASSSAHGIRLGFAKIARSGGQPNGKYICIDDLYVTDGNNLGDIANKAIRPIADGALSQWVPSTGVSDYPTVDDDIPNSDTDYIYADTVGFQETFPMVDVSATTNVVIPAAQIAATGRTAFLNAAVAANGIARIGGVNYSSTSTAIGTPFESKGYFNSGWSYDHRTEIFPYLNNPSSGGTWSPASISTTEWGVERTV